MTAYQKTENLLRNYGAYQLSIKLGGKCNLTKACVDRIDGALASLSGKKYIDIIKMHYVDKMTMEAIAEHYDISVVATYAQKKKLINALKNILCSEDAIKELLQSE